MSRNNFYYLLILLLSLGLVACGGDSSDTSESSEPGVETEQEEASEDANAVDYPTRDIQILVGHGAGGGTDNFTRTVAKLMEESLGVNINVINQEGAGGVIAKENGANEPADGYTLVATSALPMQVALGTNTENELNVYQPIARVQSDTSAIQVKTGAFDGIDDFIEQAEANPGTIKIGGTGIGTIDDINFNMFKNETGLDIIFVPFEGAGQMHAAVLGGHVDAMMEEVGPTISSIEGGEIEPILFFSEERPEAFSDIPTTVEKGWDLTNGAERGLLIRNDVPQEIIDLLEQAVKDAYETEEYKEYEKNSYLHLREGWLGSKDYYEKLENDIQVFTEIMESIQ